MITIHERFCSHCNSLSNGCVTKRTFSHSRYIGSTISSQTKMIERTKQDSFLSILANHTKISFAHQEILQEIYIYLSIYMLTQYEVDEVQ